MTELTLKEKQMQSTLSELVIYTIFLVLLSIATYGMFSPSMYYLTRSVKRQFIETKFTTGTAQQITFEDIKTTDHFWAFVRTLFYDTIYLKDWFHTEKNTEHETTANNLLGSPRIRQLRVKDDSCIIHEDFQRIFSECFDYYSPQAEDTESFGLKESPGWTYHSPADIEGTDYTGKISTYRGGGFYEDLPIKAETALSIIEKLQQNGWITHATRVVFIDFTIYNSNVNLFSLIKLVFEFPPCGGVVPGWSFRTIKLLRYVSPWEYFVMACEWICALYIFYFTFEEIKDIHQYRLKYFSHFWNFVDAKICIIGYIVMAYAIYRTVKVSNLIDKTIENPDKFNNFETIGNWQITYNYIIAAGLFLSWIKVFKYMNFNKTMIQLSQTLSKSAKDIMEFAVMFFIIFLAFAQLGYLLFGTQVEDFSSVTNSLFTLLRTILGDFDYIQIEKANRILGPLFFLSYIFFVFFILLNMFLAIINDTYFQVKSEIQVKNKNDLTVGDYLKRGWSNFFSKCERNPKQAKKPSKDGGFTTDMIRDALRKANFNDLEINTFFAKYGIVDGKELGEYETRKILSDLEGRQFGPNQINAPAPRRRSSVRISEQSAITFQLTAQQERLDQIEGTVNRMGLKLDAILRNFEQNK